MSSACRLLVAGFAAAVCSGGCRWIDYRATADTALAGAAPVSGIPVGRIPGAGAQSALPPNPYDSDPVALAEGRRLFVRFNCFGCHGGRGGGGMGPSLRDPDWLYGGAPAQIHNSIADGRAHGMPAWGTTLPDEYVWKLTAYIQSLGGPDEPEAPR